MGAASGAFGGPSRIQEIPTAVYPCPQEAETLWGADEQEPRSASAPTTHRPLVPTPTSRPPSLLAGWGGRPGNGSMITGGGGGGWWHGPAWRYLTSLSSQLALASSHLLL